MVIWLLSYIVEFVVKSASVAHGLAVRVPPPQGRLGRLAVGAGGALPPGCALLENGEKQGQSWKDQPRHLQSP